MLNMITPMITPIPTDAEIYTKIRQAAIFLDPDMSSLPKPRSLTPPVCTTYAWVILPSRHMILCLWMDRFVNGCHGLNNSLIHNIEHYAVQFLIQR